MGRVSHCSAYHRLIDVGPVSVAEFEEDGSVDMASVKCLVDGGTEGFKGHCRVIIPGVTPCFDCTLWLFPPQTKFPLCTLAETPRCCLPFAPPCHLPVFLHLSCDEARDETGPWISDQLPCCCHILHLVRYLVRFVPSRLNCCQIDTASEPSSSPFFQKWGLFQHHILLVPVTTGLQNGLFGLDELLR